MILSRRYLKAAIILFLFTTIVTAEDWPNWRGPDHNGISREKNWNPEKLRTPDILWTAEVGAGYSNMVVKGDHLYTMGCEILKDSKIVKGKRASEDTVYCINSRTGKTVWKYKYKSVADKFTGPRSTPVIDKNKLYTLSQKGSLICFNRFNGKVLWQKDMEKDLGIKNRKYFGFSGTPYIYKNMLLFSLTKGGIAVNKSTGALIWKNAEEENGFSSPLVIKLEGKTFVANFSGTEFHLTNPATGKIEAAFPWPTKYNENCADPVMCGNKIFLSAEYGMGSVMLEYKKGKLKQVWKNMNMSNLFSTSVYIDGYIYGIDGKVSKAALKCIEASTGKEMWAVKLKFGALIAADNKIIFLNEPGKVFVFKPNPAKFETIAEGKVFNKGKCWTAPVLANGILYVKSNEGKLKAVAVK